MRVTTKYVGIIPLTHSGTILFLALWADSAAETLEWCQAFDLLVSSVERYAQVRYGCEPRRDGFRRDLTDNLMTLSNLAGFTTADTWYAKPTSTLRFSEIIAKIYASKFTVMEIIFLFTVTPRIPNEHPFPIFFNLTDPLAFPEKCQFDLWCLRRKLLADIQYEMDPCLWTWNRIQEALQECGYSPTEKEDPLRTLAEHFFPFVLEENGIVVSEVARQFRVNLTSSGTNPLMWNAPHKGPFRFDATAQQLWTTLPLRDEHVIDKLRNVRQLSNDEIKAIQSLYFAPRAMLSPFAVIFGDFRLAVRKLLHESDPEERFRYFQRHVGLFYHQCKIVARHIAEHVDAMTHHKSSDDGRVAWHVLRALSADENQPIQEQWENDCGESPQKYRWDPNFSGSAFAALLGLRGTGLVGEFNANNATVWRDITGGLTFFGRPQDEFNSPIPTILPSPGFASEPAPKSFATMSNGFTLNGQILGGAQPFRVTWSGAFLVENAGKYTFYAGSPLAAEEPNFQTAKHHRWLIILRQGEQILTVLNHRWKAQSAPQSVSHPLSLERGAYHIEIDLEQPSPTDNDEYYVHLQQTGFQLKYCGPDTQDKLISIAVQSLFHESTPCGIKK